MSVAQELISKMEHLKRERSTFENHWAEIAPLVIQRQDDFFENRTEPGEKKGRNKFDDTASLAIVHGAAAIESVVSPRSSKWHKIALPEAIEDDKAAQEWADKYNNFLFKKRYSSTSNFASQLHECYMSLLAFGTAVLIVEDNLDGSIRYKSSHISEHHFMENIHGKIDINYRKYRLTAREITQKFKQKTPKVVSKTMEKDPSKKFDILHVVMPDEDRESGFNFISYYVLIDCATLIDVSGFHSFPYIISRWTTSPNEIYGRSPAMTILSEIKMLNKVRHTDIKSRHMAAAGPLLAADQKSVRKFSLKENAMNYGTLDMNGNPLVKRFSDGSRFDVSNDLINQSREFINRAFFLNLFQILVESPAMTATEVLQRAQEKGQLLTPSAGRQMSELLEPTVMRETSIYESYGLFEDGQYLELPASLKEVGGTFDIKYTNPLSRMQQAEDALGAERTIQSLLPIAQIDPSVLQRVDWKEYSDIIREANGAPANLFKSDEEMQAIAEAQQQQAQMQELLQAAPQMAGAVKDVAQAQSYMNEVA